MPIPIRVAVVEDQSITREALHVILRGTPGFVCSGVYVRAEEALAALPRVRPDVVLMDLQLPGMSGIEAIRRLRADQPNLLIVVLTIFDRPQMVFEALKAGAHGYLLKETPPAEILEAIRELVAGGSPMSPVIARLVIKNCHQTTPVVDQGVAALTPREVEVLEHLAGGRTYSEIAELLGVAVSTIRNHLRSIYDKLQAQNAPQAVARYLGRPPGDSTTA